MPFTVLFAMLALIMLVIIFGLTFKLKGLKIAFITTGIAFVIFTILFVAMINAIINAM